jgi:hypothetical protein
MRRSKYLFVALAVSALALAAVPASAGVAVTTTRVSVNSAGASGNPCSGCSSNLPISISATGRFVAFSDNAPNLVEGDRNFRYDVYVRDRVRGKTTRVSVNSAGAEANDGSIWLPAISDNGRFVAFFSRSTNLVPNDHNGLADFFVRDRKLGETTRVSVSSAEEEQTPGPGAEELGIVPALSHNGRFVAF